MIMNVRIALYCIVIPTLLFWVQTNCINYCIVLDNDVCITAL